MAKGTNSSNSHYEVGFVAKCCVSGILPRLFAAGKPLPQGYHSKMRIAEKNSLALAFLEGHGCQAYTFHYHKELETNSHTA